MRNTIIVSVLLFIAVVVASVFYFGDLNKEKKEAVRPIQHLPADTYLITSFVNDASTDKTFMDFEIFEAMLGKQQMDQLNHLKNHVLRSQNLDEYINGNDVFISLHPGKESVSTLFSVPSQTKLKQAEVDQGMLTISSKYKVTTQDTAGIRIYQFLKTEKDTVERDNKLTDSIFYVSYLENIFFASFDKELLFKINDRKTPKLNEEQLTFFNEHNNRNAPFTVYLPQQNMPAFVAAFKENRAGDFLRQFINLKGQTVWNINYKNDALMLTGESELVDTEKEYIALFANQQKSTQRLYNYFPSNSMIFIEYSFSDASTWFSDLSRWQSTQDNFKQLQGQETQLKKEKEGMLDAFRNNLAGNFAVVEQTNSDYLGFVSLKDSTVLDSTLSDFAESVGDSIYRFRYANMPYRFFGDGLKAFSRPYFILIDDLLVMANHQSTLTQYRRKWNRRDLLVGELGFKNYEQIQGNEANVTFFLNSGNAKNFLQNVLNDKYSRNFRNDEEYGYQEFYSWSLQLSGNGGNFLSRFYAIYKSKNRLGENAEWEYKLGSRLINGPYVFEYADTSQMIIAQEQDHTLHAIHPSGTKQWSTLVAGRLVGGIQQLKDRSLLAVTDRRRLYRMDTEGKNLSGFSTSLPAEPTGKPIVVDWDGQERIIIPASSRLLAYDMDGGSITGWDNVQVEGEILGSPQLLDNQIVVQTSYGRIYFFDATGNEAKQIDLEGDVNFVSPLAVLNRDNRYIFYAVDDAGQVHEIQGDGTTKVVTEGTWRSGFKVYVENIQGNSTPEMLITDGNVLQVYELADPLRAVFDYTFSQNIADEPLFFPAPGGMKQLGIAVQGNNLIYVFNSDGGVLEGFPLEAQPLFYYGKINYNTGNYLISTKRDFKLYAYRH